MKRLWLCILALSLVMTAGCGTLADMPSATNEDNALQTVETWARLAAVPETASNLSVEVEGSELTRASA